MAALRGSFNPRAREGRDLSRSIRAQNLTCFNPRAREGRDLISVQIAFHELRVSIHAPARGATSVARPCQRQFIVSIHAPARGAT